MDILLGAYNIRSLNDDEQWESTGPGNLWTAWAIVQFLVKKKQKQQKAPHKQRERNKVLSFLKN